MLSSSVRAIQLIVGSNTVERGIADDRRRRDLHFPLDGIFFIFTT